MKTLAGDWRPNKPSWSKTLSPERREGFAKWVVGRLSTWISKDEIIEVLKLARKLATTMSVSPPAGAEIVESPKKGKGRPSKWGL
jgi:hypothetical protein